MWKTEFLDVALAKISAGSSPKTAVDEGVIPAPKVLPRTSNL
jgi:hypothetical protein